MMDDQLITEGGNKYLLAVHVDAFFPVVDTPPPVVFAGAVTMSRTAL